MSIGFSAKVFGAAQIAKALGKQIEALGGSPKCEVGVGTTYAVPVHERVEVFHNVGGPYFLRSVIDEIRSGYLAELNARVQAHAGEKRPLAVALYEMGLRVDAMMVPRIPVKTGRLRSSHYVAPPKGAQASGTPDKPKTTAEGRATAREALGE